MEEGSKAISKLRSFAKELSRSLEEPIGSMNVLGEMKSTAIAPPFVVSSKRDSGERSPARTLMDYYRMIREERDDGKTLEETSGKSRAEIENEIQDALDSEIESEYNFLGYRFLYELECFLRDIIQERVVDVNQDNIGNFVPKNILQQCLLRKETEE